MSTYWDALNGYYIIIRANYQPSITRRRLIFHSKHDMLFTLLYKRWRTHLTRSTWLVHLTPRWSTAQSNSTVSQARLWADVPEDQTSGHTGLCGFSQVGGAIHGQSALPCFSTPGSLTIYWDGTSIRGCNSLLSSSALSWHQSIKSRGVTLCWVAVR